MLFTPLVLSTGCTETPVQQHVFKPIESIVSHNEFKRSIDIEHLKAVSPKDAKSDAQKQLMVEQKATFAKTDQWRNEKRNSECIQVLLSLLEKQKKIFGEHSIHLISTYRRLRKSNESISQITEAEKYGLLACKESEFYFGPYSPDSVHLRLDFARVIAKQGRHAEAEDMLIDLEKRLQNNAVSCASEPALLVRLGEIYMDEGKYQRASAVLKSAQEKTQQRLPDTGLGPSEKFIESKQSECAQLLSGNGKNTAKSQWKSRHKF